MPMLYLSDVVVKELREKSASVDLTPSELVGQMLGVAKVDKRVKYDFTSMSVLEELTIDVSDEGIFMSVARAVDSHNKRFAPQRWGVQFNGAEALITRLV